MGLFDRIFQGGKRRLTYPADLQSQIERAMAGLQAQTAAHDGLWQIGQAAWSVDQDQGTITFTSPKGLRAKAPVQIVGSYDTRDGTWLWGWENPSIAPTLTEHARKVRAYGQEKGFDVLTTPQLTCPEEQCWELAALACMLAEAQGAYRGPAGTARVFLAFGQVQLTKATS
jgi:hypothetical protein